ncbi:hypothetical protein C6N75_12445 [Streptomyces solincola]|uniref:Barstar (barnase inhibitor) domain-containing protein n=1 Tax=Streptomyces solincola TaxID=2100817 RepID=A0A2S9PWV5_9ACTN|nr:MULTISPECIES: barstar family protein [Streptomyces]PRH78898.1 hypothetical protein C6N75_12445 [Streptomyces solincola]
MTHSERDGELTVDLRGAAVGTLEDFWDAVAAPCALPGWFGRNLDAWADALNGGGVSAVVDGHTLVVHADRRGLFAGDRPEARALAAVFEEGRHRLVVHPEGG